VLGAIVGIVVVAQTLYAATVEHLSEYATILAIGAPNHYLNRIVINQALISAVSGFALGIVVAAAVVAAAANSNVALFLSWRLATTVGLATLVMCGTASLVAVRKIKNVEPTTIFR
jgi:putative ABC transport system permease protein